MQKHIIFPLCFIACLFMAGQVMAHQPFPDTGQTRCYNNEQEFACPKPGESFYGQDAHYQPRLPRSYTKLGRGGIELSDEEPHVDKGGNWIMTRDNVTGLIWEIKTNANKDNEYNWQDAQDVFVVGLNKDKFGGFSDWRVPAIKELSSLVNSENINPNIEMMWFPNAKSLYWSSSSSGSSAYWIYFRYTGNVGESPKGNNAYVRAVRGEGDWNQGLIDNNDGTVTDPTTGLMWQKGSSPARYVWEDALVYAENLSLAGYDDWRLPNRNELHSLVDYSQENPAIDPLLADDTKSSWGGPRYWSSTTNAEHANRVWSADFYQGRFDKSTSKITRGYVRAVRAGEQGVYGSLIIEFDPFEVVDDGAQWRPVGSKTWYGNGEDIKLKPGTYEIEFKNIPGWNTPETLKVSVDSGEKIISATFVKNQNTYQISIDTENSGGSVSGADTYLHNETVTLAAVPEQGYIFSRWTENDKTVSIERSYTFPARTDRNIIAHFTQASPLPFDVIGEFVVVEKTIPSPVPGQPPQKQYFRAIDPVDGEIMLLDTADSNSLIIRRHYGPFGLEAMTFYVHETGYRLLCISGVLVGSSRQRVALPEAQTTLQVVYSGEKIILTGSQGTPFVGFPDVKVFSVSSVITPGTGALQASIEPDNASESGAQWKRRNTESWFDSDHAEFDVLEGQYELEFSVLPGWDEPQKRLVTVRPKATSIVTAEYIRNPSQHKVVAAIEGSGGTIAGDGKYLHNTWVTLTATPDQGYRFLYWTINGQIVSTDQKYTFLVTENTEILAHFEQLPSDLPGVIMLLLDEE